MEILTPSQSIIASDIHRFRVVCCGRRFGKTTLAVEEIKACAAQGGKRIAYIANTYQQARDIAWEALKKELRTAGVQINESRLELKFKGINSIESVIILRGWESIETLRGQAFDLVVLDEVASMRYFDVNWQEVIRPTLTDTKGQVLFIGTPKGFNHFYDLFNEQAKDTDFRSFHFTSYDNPFLPKEEIDKAKLELTEDRFAQEYLADFRKTEGLVYKEFNRERHVYDNLDTNKVKVVDKLGGIDFGYTNPAAVLVVYKDSDSNYWVDDEWYKTQKTDGEIAEYAASLGFNKAYPDPESPGAIEELRKRGVNVQEVIKGKDSVVSGIQRVREMFKQNRLHINRRCVNTILELETYHYPDFREGNSTELPEKEDDHAMDALRYVLTMNDYRRVQSKTQEEILRERELLKQFDFNRKKEMLRKRV